MIKTIKPKRGIYKQGYLDPRSSTKYVSDGNPIIYRSSYEKKFIQWLESNDDIIHWASETLEIPYMLNGKQHGYYPDFIAETKNGIYVFEIKPLNQTKDPRTPYEKEQYMKNIAKWTAAKEYCESRDMKFRIITEATLNKL